MTMSHPRRLFGLLGAVSVSIAAAAETSAQSRPTPHRPLSHAIAEVLRGPFHVEHASAPVHGRILPPSASAPRFPDVRVPSIEDGPPRGWMMVLTTVSAALGYGGMFYAADHCDPVVPVSVFPSLRDTPGYCEHEAVLYATGIATTIAITAGAATYVGSGFRRSLIASALGSAGAWAGTALTLWGTALGSAEDGKVVIPMAIMSLTHAGITTLIAG